MSATAVTESDVTALALGCDVLGSGGGGTTGSARLVLAHHLRDGRSVPVITDPDPDTFVACVGAYGSATLMLESLPGPAAFRAALAGLERHHQPVEALLPLEVGGVNGVLAAMVAATAGLPLVDADPMGRAFSRISDTVLAAGVPLRSIDFASAAGHSAHLEADSGAELESVLQSLLPAVGGWGAVAVFAGRAREILPYAVHGPVTHALTLGRALQSAGAGDSRALLELPGVRLVLDGWVTEVRRNPGVEVRGVASLSRRATHQRGRQPARLDFANDYLALFLAGRLEVSAPDVICVVDADWVPVPAEELRAAQQVRVLAVDAPPGLRLAHESSGTFGLGGRGYQEVWS